MAQNTVQTGVYETSNGNFVVEIDNVPGNSGKYQGSYSSNEGLIPFKVSQPSGLGEIAAVNPNGFVNLTVDASFEEGGQVVFDRWAGFFAGSAGGAVLIMNGSRSLGTADAPFLEVISLGSHTFQLQP